MILLGRRGMGEPDEILRFTSAGLEMARKSWLSRRLASGAWLDPSSARRLSHISIYDGVREGCGSLF